jgi:branched-chain amino acid transport system permease protein
MSASDQTTTESAANGAKAPPSVDAAGTRRALLRTPRPPIFRGQPYTAILAFLAAMSVYWVWRVEGKGLAGQDLMTRWVFYSIIVIGFYLVFGISGQFAFSQAAFAGLGAYTSNHFAEDHGFFVGLVAAVIVTSVVALGFALLIRKAAHFYFAIATLGISTLVLLVVRTWTSFAGVGGEVTNIRPISVFGHEMKTASEIYGFLLFVLGVVMILTVWLQRSPFVRESIANRDRETVSRTLGVPTLRLRVSSFVVGSAIAGAAGSIYAHWKGNLGPDQWSVELGLGIFLMLILGGIGSMWGAILGAWFYSFVPIWLDFLDKYQQIFYGSLLIITMVALPEGLVGTAQRLRGLRRRGVSSITPAVRMPNWLALFLGVRRSPGFAKFVEPPVDRAAIAAATAAAAARPAGEHPTGAPIVEASDISVSFGGVRAVDEVSLSVHEDEIVGLIGPNGSGKSTFVNALTGVVPAKGTLAIDGTRMPLGKASLVRRAGILRMYQAPQTYLDLSCIENVLLSTSDRHYTGILSAWFLRPLMLRHEKARWERAAAALDEVGLLDRAEDGAAGLSYGQQRLLELARVIAADPRVILLDEPSAGLNAAETQVLVRHLTRLRERGIALLVIDHKIDFISQLCDRVAVLELGHKVAEGDPVTIWEDERVISAYLGVSDEQEQWDVAESAPSDGAGAASGDGASAANVAPGREG